MNSSLVIIVLCLSVDQCLIAMVDGKSQNILEDKLEFENWQKMTGQKLLTKKCSQKALWRYKGPTAPLPTPRCFLGIWEM